MNENPYVRVTAETYKRYVTVLDVLKDTRALFSHKEWFNHLQEAADDAGNSVPPYGVNYATSWNLIGGLKHQDSAYQEFFAEVPVLDPIEPGEIIYVVPTDPNEPTEPFPCDLAMELLEHDLATVPGCSSLDDLRYKELLPLLDRTITKLNARLTAVRPPKEQRQRRTA